VPTAKTVPAINDRGEPGLAQGVRPGDPRRHRQLGLVHELTVTPQPDGTFHAKIRMGLTSPGCGMGDVLVRDVKEALGNIEGVSAVDAQVVLFPVWNPYTMMSGGGKTQARDALAIPREWRLA